MSEAEQPEGRDMSREAIGRRLSESDNDVDQAIGQLLLSSLNEEANS